MKKEKSKVQSSNPAVTDPPLQNQPMQITHLPLAQIKPDPNQPRKVFDPVKLDELAASIKAVGIQQPLKVQCQPGLKIVEPDMLNPDWQAEDHKGAVLFSGSQTAVRKFAAGLTEDSYQIIFGERRWRAAAMAGLDTLPCLVGTLTDKDRFILQFTENNARENLSALEEAGAFAAEIGKRKAITPGFNPEMLAEELGIARGTVYGRLKLTRLHGPVREALIAGKISTSVAGSIAIIPDPAKQEKLLEELTDEESQRFGSSARDVEEWIEDEFVKQLDDAPFDQKEKSEMDNGSCKTCPQRSGNMKEQFPELAKRPNICTNPACYGEKVKAHWVQQAENEQAKGTKVLTMKEFKAAKGTLVKAKDGATGYFSESWEIQLGKKAPEPVLVATQAGLEKYYPKDEAVAAAKAKGLKLPKENQPVDRAKEEAKEKEKAARKLSRQTLIEDLLPRFAKGIAGLKNERAWELMCEWTRESAHGAFEKHLVKDVKDPRHKLLGKTFGNAARPTDWEGAWNKDAVALWKELGVDLVAEETRRQNVGGTLPLANAEPKQKELLTVKSNKRKGKR